MQITPRNVADAWQEALAESPAQKRKQISTRFLEHLYRSNRLSWLPAIIRALEMRERRTSGIEAVTVTSSHTLPAQLAHKLVKEVMGNAKTSITQAIDPELLGGVQIETADNRWDLSLRTRLNRAYNRLIS